MGQERRKDPRITSKEYMVTYCLKDGANKVCDISRVADISKGGLRFFSFDKYPKGTEIIFYFRFPHISADKIEIESEVVNCYQPSPEGKTWQIGVKFKNLSPQAIEGLDQLDRLSL
jgi:hypothetical protein